MTTLLALWELSLALSAAALLALALILVARFFTEERTARSESERKRITPLLLGPALSDPHPPRGKLAKAQAARTAHQLAEMVRGPDREAVLSNAEALRIPHALWQHSVSRSAQERLLAAEALALFPSGRQRVREMLRDRNPDVRLGAALALAQNQAAPPVAELVRALGLGTRERSLLIASLMRDLVDTDPAAVETLVADETLPDRVRLAAVDALAASGRVEHAPLVARMAQKATADPDLLPRIHHALGRIGHPSGHPAILAGLSHAEWPVRAAAAQAAGNSAYSDAAEALGELLDDEQWWVRFRAGEALWRIGKAGHDVLTAVSVGESEVARQAARLTIEERQSP